MLYEDMMDDCILMKKERVPDGEGGFDTDWVEDLDIKCAITRDTTLQAQIMQSQGSKSLYTITTKRNVGLDYHDVVKRLKDGKIFRVTSDKDDYMSPDVGTLDINQVKAEKWELA